MMVGLSRATVKSVDCLRVSDIMGTVTGDANGDCVMRKGS